MPNRLITMSNYLITYEPVEDCNYEMFVDAIKSISDGYVHPLKSVWIIGHSGKASDIADALVPFINSQDKLFVTLVSVIRLGPNP